MSSGYLKAEEGIRVIEESDETGKKEGWKDGWKEKRKQGYMMEIVEGRNLQSRTPEALKAREIRR